MYNILSLRLWAGFFAVVTFLICALAADAQPTGLVAGYGFNETSGSTVTDVSGNNNTGTLGSGVTRTTQGKFGGALVFNGSSLVTVPHAASLNLTTGMTLSAWVFPTVIPVNWSTAIMKEQPGWFVYALYAGSPTNRPNIYIFTTNGENGIAGPSALALNTWSHLAATYNGATLSIYVNGAIVASQAMTGPINTATNPLRIGGNSVWGEYFTGRLDEVRVYNRALNQAEIQTDMNTAVGGIPPPDATGPSVAITSHTNNQTVTASPITVGGTASDSGLGNSGISSVTVNGVAASGGTATGSGTANWSQSVALNAGANTVTVVGRDASAAQNPTTVSITVNYNPLDTTPPAAVVNLATGTATANSIALSWTAPGDDGSGGTATSYDIRYALSQITEANWGSATQVSGEPAPLVAGSIQNFTVSGLSCATTYFFALKSSDEVPNISAISNSPSQVTSACTDATGPGVAITSHTNNQTVTASPITVGGTASDSGLGNSGISSVTVNGVAATGGTATGSGTANWSQSVALNAGANTVTVVGRDASAAQNPTTVSITVNYNPPDTTPPAAVANLATGTATANSIALSWTAPGDDGSGGTATSYDIRYALSQITEASWALATQVSGEPAPLLAGSVQNFTVSGLSCATTYFFALKSSDEVPNISAISNSPSQVTSACTDTTGPGVAITSHTNNQTVTASPITVGGTASDSGLGNSGISSVTVNGVAASGGTATGSGTANWSQSVALNAGANTVTVVGRDASAAQNPTTVSITVNYNVAQAAGLVAAYNFNEGSGTTITDASGNNNTGALSGATWTTQGKFGSALTFNGGQWVTVNDANSLDLTTGMTLEAWVYPTVTPTNWSTVIFKQHPSEFAYVLYSGSPNNRPHVVIESGGHRTVAGPTALPLNSWSHLAGTYDGATMRLFVNGLQVASLAYTGSIATSSGPLNFGRNSFWGEYFTGRIDDVRIYNRALSQAEIQTDMNTAVGGGAANMPPTITNIANQTTNEDTATAAIGFTVGDSETAAGSLTVSGSSSNTTLAPNGNIAFGGSGANRTVTVTPAANQTGVANITVTVSDGTLSTPTSFQLTVNAVNDSPTITSIANQTTTGTAVGPLNFTVGDVETAASSLVVSGSSSNTTLVPNGNIAFGGSGANRMVTVTPAANQTGVANITVTVSDGTLSTPTIFQLTVTATNTPPTITNIANQTTNEDTATAAIGFTVGDAETAAGSLTVSGSSSNTTLAPNGNIAFGGSGANRTVTATPAANQTGVANITVTVSDGTLSTPTSFQLTVNAVNDSPTITSIANQTTTGTAVGPLNFTIGDVETAASSLVVSGSSSNTTLVPNGNIVFGGSGANRTVTATPAANQTGVANITVTVSDGTLSTPTIFQLTVNTVPSGLVAAYGFNETSGSTVTDVSGNNNTGTLGSGVTRTTQGKFGSALVFNGSSFVTIPHAASLNIISGMTLSSWVFPTATPANWSTAIMKEQPGMFVYALYAGSPTNRPNIYIVTTSGENGIAGPSALPLNTWSHLAATHNGATLSIYVNGALVASQAMTGSIITSTSPLRIGGNSIWSEYFTGRLDEVRVYNRALSQAEIQTDMNTALGGTAPPPDTVPPTVSIVSPAANATVTSTITISASANDDVGVVGVQFFLDGAALGSEVTAPPYSLSWDTSTTAPGSHSLTAQARDAAGNSTMSTPVPVTVQAPAASGIGQWSSVSSWPLVAIHSILLPTGNVLAFDGAAQNGAAYIWNPTTNTFTSRNAADNIFCAGHCLLPDGRVLVVGGHIANFVGIPDANIFNSTTSSWTQIPSMSYGRWYPTAVTLPDGRVLVVAGDDGCVGCWVANPEIYDPANNTWAQLSNAPNPLPEYPHLFVLSDGRVLATGAFEQPIATQVLDVNAQTWAMVDPVVVDGHSSVMHAPDKFMKSGTSATSDPPFWPAENTTYVLDMNQPQASWRETAPMAYPRSYHNLTILPDGNVLATGGGLTTDVFDQSQAVLPAEMWSPITETWTTMASMTVPRLYHTTAVLLPDGRVAVAGGGRFGGGPADDKLSAQIYSPPYLFKGTRPSISSAPNLISYNANFTVNTSAAATIANATLIPLSSVTHHFNANQRYLSLPFQVVGNSLSVQAPANANLAQPGYYMLFIVDTNGVPSVASMIRLQ